MKGIYLIFILSIIWQPLLFSQVVVKRNNQVSKEAANVNWSKEFTLFDYTTDEPIFPLIRNGQAVYKIYYASKEDLRPNYGEFSVTQVEGLKYYKFKNRETCLKFCLANKVIAVPTLTTTSISALSTSSATSGGNITSDGGASITARGVVWSTSTNPTISLTTKTLDGTGTGSFISSITNLTPKTIYYIRAYATNSAGTGYGNEISFTTSDSSIVMGIPCPGTPTVKDIDGNTYNTVQIGTQCWTKENLRVTKYRDGTVIPLDESGGTAGNGTGQTWSSRTTGARTVYGHSASNLAIYGYLYNWYAVADPKGLCPIGWYVPSEAEWNSLSSYLGNDSGVKLADTSWILAVGKPTNESGFSVKPGGYRDTSGRFSAPLISGNFWSTTKKSSSNIFKGRGLYSKEYWDTYSYYGVSGLSVRCLKDSNSIVSKPTLTTTAINAITTTSSTSGGNITSDGGASISARGVVWSTSTNPTIALTTKTSDGTGTGSFSSTLSNLTPKTTYYVRAYATNSAGTGYGNEITFTTSDSIVVMGIPCPSTPTVKDIDGNTYNTVQIGTQCWTKENLRVTKYRDGSIIPLDESGGISGKEGVITWTRNTGARTVYANSSANFDTYGYLYNWYAVADKKGICPIGWHVPSDVEWSLLTSFLGGDSVAGGKMKTIGTVNWQSPNTGATNESGFSALPGGFRLNDIFVNIKLNAYFWTTTENNNTFAWYRGLDYYYGKGVDRRDNLGKPFGVSIRCLKDTISIVSIPTLTTTAISAISATSATSGGIIISDGGVSIIARGVVWSTSTNPTINLTTKTSDGTGTGSFTSSLTNLVPKTTYYVRAYATNSTGTGYGNEISFTTADSSNVMGIPCPGTPTVKDIDGNTYNTVQIGTQCWTKENLRVTKYRDGSIIPLDESGGTEGNGIGETWSSRTTGARTVYGHSAANLATYGYLYNWHAVADSKGLCPSGWHVPTSGEWSTLTIYLGGMGNKMKKQGITKWSDTRSLVYNESGFSAIPAGYRDSQIGIFGGANNDYSSSFFWSTSDYFCIQARFLSLYGNYGVIDTLDSNLSNGKSIRCIKDSLTLTGSVPTISTTQVSEINSNSAASGGIITSDGGKNVLTRGVVWWTYSTKPITFGITIDGTGTGSFTSTILDLTPNTTYYVKAYATNVNGKTCGNKLNFTTTKNDTMGIPCPGTPTVKDIDGNTYTTVQIGTQCWTKENLRVTKYRDGSVIPLDESGWTAGNFTGQTWSSRTTGARTVYGHSSSNLATYGYLYNWYAVSDTKGLCPNGWHVPIDGEWTNSTNYLGGESVAGGKMKTTGTTFWNSPNTGATNESGFSALPGGYRNFDGGFYFIRSYAFFWSATEFVSSFAWGRSLYYVSSSVFRSSDVFSKSVGASVRCLRD